MVAFPFVTISEALPSRHSRLIVPLSPVQVSWCVHQTLLLSLMPQTPGLQRLFLPGVSLYLQNFWQHFPCPNLRLENHSPKG